MNLSDVSAVFLKDGERADDLQRGGLRIIQHERLFRFGTDAVLLADFALIKHGALTADFGTGTGAIALLLAGRHPDIRVTALELQKEPFDMARRSVIMNGLEERINVLNADIKNAPALIGRGVYDAVVCNPPYYKEGSGAQPEGDNGRISRFAGEMTVDSLCGSASAVLKSGGRLSVVFPAARMQEMMSAMERHALAPKRVRTVHATSAHVPKIVLLDAVKHGGEGLMWLPPLILKNADGTPTEEWNRIYG